MQDARRLIIRFSIIEFVYYGALAGGNYITNYLSGDLGFSSTVIGTVIAVGSLLAMASSLVFGSISDRLGSSRRVLVFCCGCAGVLYLMFPIFHLLGLRTLLPFCLLIPAVYLFRVPTMALLDSWCNTEIAPHGINYGLIRLWGSAGFSICSILISTFVVTIHTSLAFLWTFVAFVPLVIYVLRVKETVVPVRKTQKEKLQLGKLFKNYYFMSYTMLTLATNVYTAIDVIFMPYIMTRMGVDPIHLGLIVGYRSIMEIVCMCCTGKLRKRIPLRYLVASAALLGGIEHVIYATTTGLAPLLIAITLSGLAGGIAYSQGPSYVHEIVPQNLKSTAQVFNSISLSMVSILGTFFGGRLIEAHGVGWFTGLLSILILSIFVFFVVSLIVGKKVVKPQQETAPAAMEMD